MTERVDIAALKAHAAKGWGTDALIPKSVIELLCAELQAARATPADHIPSKPTNEMLNNAVHAWHMWKSRDNGGNIQELASLMWEYMVDKLPQAPQPEVNNG